MPKRNLKEVNVKKHLAKHKIYVFNFIYILKKFFPGNYLKVAIHRIGQILFYNTFLYQT